MHTPPPHPSSTLSPRPVLLALCLLVAACGGSPDAADESPVERDPLLRPDDFDERAPDEYRVTLETTEGDVVIHVHRTWAPLGADRFYNLAKGGFYDDTRVYRVIPGFMAQFGLHGDPYVNQAWKDEYIVDDPVTRPNTRGTVAFAKGGVHSRTTEVFVNYRDNRALDEEGFAPFGEVVEGMDVVESFYGEYGDGPPRGEGPYQAMARARGNAYLDEEFPQLTRIVDVTVEPVSGG